MKLSSKILYCRKKAGLSQEALAELIGVSRQAISKWETEEATPEIGKLSLLARTFNVSVDWLLSETEVDEENNHSSFTSTFTSDNCSQGNSQDYSDINVQHVESWIDSAPKLIQRIFKRFGWLGGIYITFVGLSFTFVGTMARIITKVMLTSYKKATDTMFGTGGAGIGNISLGNSSSSISALYGESSNSFSDIVSQQTTSFAENNPVIIFGTILIVIGIVLMLAGTVLAIYLKKHSKENIG